MIGCRSKSDTDQIEIAPMLDCVAGQEGDGKRLPGMIPKKLLPRRREQVCWYQLAGLLLHLQVAILPGR